MSFIIIIINININIIIILFFIIFEQCPALCVVFRS